jgi:UrcA family protein
MGQARVIGLFSVLTGGSAMTRSNSVFSLNRASERVSSAAAAVALTFLMLLAVDVRADSLQDNPPSVTVRFSELALADSANAATVYQKLHAAARRVCGLNRGADSLKEHLSQLECYQAAMDDAVRKVDRPTLTALHSIRSRNLG